MLMVGISKIRIRIESILFQIFIEINIKRGLIYLVITFYDRHTPSLIREEITPGVQEKIAD